MDEEKRDLKRLQKEEDDDIAHRLAAALCEDNVEIFLQLYDEIPVGISQERLGNIKEMARQLAALTRTASYRHSPIAVKESPFFGINHTLQTTSLVLNGQFSDFKTPPEGCTPVDQKHFDYGEEALKTASLSFYEKQLNDSGITQQECLDFVINGDECGNERCSKSEEVGTIKTNDDDSFEFHTPPEFQDNHNEGPPFGYPPSSDQIIDSVINLLSKTATLDSKDDEVNSKNCLEEKQDIKGVFEVTEVVEQDDIEENGFQKDRSDTAVTDLEQDASSEKDSLDGSQESRKSFTQEEDDSGISLVDENDVVHESSLTNGGHFEVKKDDTKCEERNYSSSQRTSSSEKKPSEYELLKYSKSNSNYEAEDTSVGWQTRSKRMSKKRGHDNREFERMNYHGDQSSTPTESRKESTPRRSSRTKDRNGRSDKSESYSKVAADRHTEEGYRERNAWSGGGRREDSEVNESPKRSGRRGGQGGKKSDNKHTKNGSRDTRYSDKADLGSSQDSSKTRQSVPQPASVFSYRDALLKAGAKVASTKEQMATPLLPSKVDRMFDLESAVKYLSSAWTSVNNLHRKDPSKVYIYNGD